MTEQTLLAQTLLEINSNIHPDSLKKLMDLYQHWKKIHKNGQHPNNYLKLVILQNIKILKFVKNYVEYTDQFRNKDRKAEEQKVVERQNSNKNQLNTIDE